MYSTLKSTPVGLTNNENSNHLKVIKSQVQNEEAVKRIYINSLMPGFSYNNKSGELIIPRNCALL
jgi:hypothetical protein